MDEIFNKIKEYYGIDVSKFKYLKRGEKLYLVSDELYNLIEKINFKYELAGLYVIKVEKNNVRFSIEGSQIFGKYSKRIVEIEPEKLFFSNIKKIEIERENGFYIAKYGKDFFGTILIKNKEVKDFIPKERKLARFYNRESR